MDEKGIMTGAFIRAFLGAFLGVFFGVLIGAVIGAAMGKLPLALALRRATPLALFRDRMGNVTDSESLPTEALGKSMKGSGVGAIPSSSSSKDPKG